MGLHCSTYAAARVCRLLPSGLHTRIASFRSQVVCRAASGHGLHASRFVTLGSFLLDPACCRFRYNTATASRCVLCVFTAAVALRLDSTPALAVRCDSFLPASTCLLFTAVSRWILFCGLPFCLLCLYCVAAVVFAEFSPQVCAVSHGLPRSGFSRSSIRCIWHEQKKIRSAL